MTITEIPINTYQYFIRILALINFRILIILNWSVIAVV